MNPDDPLSVEEIEAARLAQELARLLEEVTKDEDASRPAAWESAGGESARAPRSPADAADSLSGSLLNELTPMTSGAVNRWLGKSILGTASVQSLILGPVWASLVKLFGRDEEDPAPVTDRYEPPGERIWDLGYRAGEGAGLFALDRDSSGAPRAWNPPSNPPRSTSPAPVHVEIHALDSRSILDRSDDLAEAVRRAISESHRLNDYLVEE